ncbi:cyclic pyranopterin monophosphate synthase MoaC [Candidatus Sumerlaeota bacterium]|nr:cyclic pyranopterin monophosphate synthase MoaC [Candidatus Sumerlaeota bacterium]
MKKKRMTHLDESGAAHMVDVSPKDRTDRVAIAEGMIRMNADARAAFFSRATRKGDAVAVARVAGIMAAKRTSELIPLCHPLAPASITMDIEPVEKPLAVRVRATIRVTDRTGAEMEALTAVSVALLTVYDMLKSIQKDMVITSIRLRRKSGGRSGDLSFR